MNHYDLWRIDATHESGGGFCEFRRNRSDGDTVAFALRQAGWNVAIRPATDFALQESEEARLCGGTWPPLDNYELLRFLRNGREQMKRQLHGAIQRRDLRSKTPKYGTTRR